MSPSQAPWTYQGFAYRQAADPASPWLVSLVVPAEEVLSWAGIPRRAQPGLIGFQRTEDQARIDKAANFFRQGKNQSPTSLVLGLNPSPERELYRISFEKDGDARDTILPCKLEILHDPDQLDLNDIVQIVEGRIRERLDGSRAEIMPDAEGSADDDPDETTIEDLQAETDVEDPNEVELGTSILETLLNRLADPIWVANNEVDLRDLAKPATVIDGQHRVLGAAKCAREIPFSVVAMVECSWAEQVFQFTVVNYTSKGIPDQFITANAALSLTAAELNDLQTRLTQAGVKVVEYELMRRVNFDESSPFFDLVNLTERPVQDKIGYKTMVRIAKDWHGAKDPALQLLVRSLYPDIRGSSTTSRQARLALWREDDWGDFFIAFWDVVKSRYRHNPSHQDGHFLWEVGHSQLMIAVVLHQLQLQFFANLRAQDEDFWDVGTDERGAAREVLLSKLRRRAEKVLDSVPAEFFSTKWGTTSLNTGAGRRDLSAVIDSLIQTKGKFQYSRSSLVTGKSE